MTHRVPFPRPVREFTGTNLDLETRDANGDIECTGAVSVTGTVPLDSTLFFENGTTIRVFQYGAGSVLLTGEAGVSLRGDGNATVGQYGRPLELIKLGPDEWLVTGGVAV